MNQQKQTCKHCKQPYAHLKYGGLCKRCLKRGKRYWRESR